MRRHLFLPLPLIACLLLAACHGSNEPTEPADEKALLRGEVELYDDLGGAIADRSGVTVSIVGTNLTTTTNSDGLWSLENPPGGTQDIRFEKSTFLGYVRHAITIATNDTTELFPVVLAQVPRFSVTELTGPVTNHVTYYPEGDTARIDTVDVIVGTLSEAPSESGYHLRYFIGSKPTVGPGRSHNSFFENGLHVPAGSTSFAIPLPYWFRGGEGGTFYIAVYPCAVGSASDGIDSRTGDRIDGRLKLSGGKTIAVVL